MDFDIARILRILPHRAPFVMLDRVLDLQPGKSARAIKCVTYNEPYMAAHFPSYPVFPGVLILEAMSQLTGILAYASEPFDTQAKMLYFLGIERAKFRKPVHPGDRLEITVELLRRRSNIWKTEAVASVDGQVAAEGEILAAVMEREELPGR